ncbi:MAG: hypothetical protein V4572_04970 [Bacteroidota bacterium]
MEETLWTKIIPKSQIDESMGQILDENSNKPIMLVNYEITSDLKLVCTKYTYYNDDNDKPITTISIKGEMKMSYKNLVSKRLRAVFSTKLFYTNGSEYPDFVTPSCNLFLGPNQIGVEELVSVTCEVMQSYSGLVKGDFPNKTRIDSYAGER